MLGTRRDVLAGAAAATWMAARPGAAFGDPGRSDVVESGGLSIHLFHYSKEPRCLIPVIYVHGATFPSSLAVAWRFGANWSWADDLVGAGYDVWGFDFAGYGASDRYREMAAAPAPGPLGRSDEAVRQLAAVVAKVRRKTGSKRVILLAHSWVRSSLRALPPSSRHSSSASFSLARSWSAREASSPESPGLWAGAW